MTRVIHHFRMERSSRSPASSNALRMAMERRLLLTMPWPTASSSFFNTVSASSSTRNEIMVRRTICFASAIGRPTRLFDAHDERVLVAEPFYLVATIRADSAVLFRAVNESRFVDDPTPIDVSKSSDGVFETIRTSILPFFHEKTATTTCQARPLWVPRSRTTAWARYVFHPDLPRLLASAPCGFFQGSVKHTQRNLEIAREPRIARLMKRLLQPIDVVLQLFR